VGGEERGIMWWTHSLKSRNLIKIKTNISDYILGDLWKSEERLYMNLVCLENIPCGGDF